jgi:hypothetical protein
MSLEYHSGMKMVEVFIVKGAAVLGGAVESPTLQALNPTP